MNEFLLFAEKTNFIKNLCQLRIEFKKQHLKNKKN